MISNNIVANRSPLERLHCAVPVKFPLAPQLAGVATLVDVIARVKAILPHGTPEFIRSDNGSRGYLSMW